MGWVTMRSDTFWVNLLAHYLEAHLIGVTWPTPHMHMNANIKGENGTE